jgi:LCP family protein required for cell wall assembly
MVEEDYNQEPKSSRWNSLLLVVFVVVMAVANIWMIQKAFSGNDGDLPKLKVNVFSASSFVIKNSQQTASDAAGFFSETRNILVLGKSGGSYIAPNLTDTIFVAHINGPAKKIQLISIPRDLAVKIPGGNGITKINALYQIGLEKSETEGLKLIQTKVEEITGLKIDSFAMFDLASVEKIIDDIGGINVFVKEDINDTRFPTPTGGYEIFRLEKGMRYLDGKTTLKFIRTRNSPGGDFDRIARQQQVLMALKGKLLSLNPVWNFGKIWSIFRTVQKNLRTDLSLSDMKNIWSLAKNIDLETIKTFSINADSGLIADQKMVLGKSAAYTLVAKPKPFDYANIKSAINNFLIK